MALVARRTHRSNELMAELPQATIVATTVVRLQNILPHVAHHKIEAEVVAVLRSYEGSRVEVFLPILVERQALANLRGRSGSDAA